MTDLTHKSSYLHYLTSLLRYHALFITFDLFHNIIKTLFSFKWRETGLSLLKLFQGECACCYLGGKIFEWEWFWTGSCVITDHRGGFLKMYYGSIRNRTKMGNELWYFVKGLGELILKMKNWWFLRHTMLKLSKNGRTSICFLTLTTLVSFSNLSSVRRTQIGSPC